jgi:hypothetical protein
LTRSACHSVLLSLTVLHWVGSFNVVAAAYSVSLLPGSEECFYVHTPKDRPVLIS